MLFCESLPRLFFVFFKTALRFFFHVNFIFPPSPPCSLFLLPSTAQLASIGILQARAGGGVGQDEGAASCASACRHVLGVIIGHTMPAAAISPRLRQGRRQRPVLQPSAAVSARAHLEVGGVALALASF